MAEGSDRANGSLVKMDSIESRWVFQDEDDSDEGGVESSYESAEEDNVEQRLIRTGPRIDSFDVEALEVPGAQRHDYEDFNLGRSLILVLQTLGVVFGDVGTSPLYTFDIMFNKYPISEKEDVLGALSLVLYTLILIPLVKYTLIVLWGNDDGEGGTFALYSLICRNAKASLLPNQLPSDARISSFRLKVPSAELERSLKLKEHLENSAVLKKMLLILVLFGTAMVIAGGVATPAMSGSEAMFADLCYFSVRSVQSTFIFLVLPCLLPCYLGQATFLMENPTQNDQVDLSFEGLDGGAGSLIKWNPVANVEGKDIWNFLRTLDVPVNPLHSQPFENQEIL